MTLIDPAGVGRRLDALRTRLDAVDRRTAGTQVSILAVTKGFGVDAVEAALAVGLPAVGENYAQELLAKAQHAYASPPEWHFIGRLQRNKVRQLAPIVAVWQSVDRASLADEIARRAPGARIFVQLNLSDEPQKGGAPIHDGPALVAHARGLGLDVQGLMGVAPAGDPEAARPGFRALVALADELSVAQRSIGMSADLEIAVEEGSTLIRIGSGLFGSRPTAAPVEHPDVGDVRPDQD
jgi:PLP dependent protein